jgi:hypothetical protein
VLAHGVGYRERKEHWMGKEYVKNQRQRAFMQFALRRGRGRDAATAASGERSG